LTPVVRDLCVKRHAGTLNHFGVKRRLDVIAAASETTFGPHAMQPAALDEFFSGSFSLIAEPLFPPTAPFHATYQKPSAFF
jgi:hypothetical protein